MGCLMELILNFFDVFLMVSLVDVNACVVGNYVCTDIRMKLMCLCPLWCLKTLNWMLVKWCALSEVEKFRGYNMPLGMRYQW